VIYDEIDAGTSGAVAEAIGVRLKALSAHQQVIAITHLPQVAACADHHMVIEKHSDAKQAHTTLRALSSKEREEELARLISGKVVTQEAKRAATKLLQAAQ
jgi:DNA repair protein RecN (Recombination protein N)